MSQAAWLMHTLGRIEAGQEAGFQNLHRRLELQDRNDTEWRRFMLRRMDHIDRRKNGGNGKIPYAKIAVLLGLIILGALGHMAPAATKSAIQDVLKIGIRHVTSG